MVSQAKLNQIPTELKRNGIEPTQQHIDAVTAILQSDGRASVSSAVRRYAQSQQSPDNNQTATAPTGDKLQDDLSRLSDLLGDRIAEGIISKAVDKAVDRIQGGNWSVNSKSKSKLENLKEALDCEFEVVEENFLSLPTNGLSNGKLLSASVEETNSELITQS